MAKLSDLLSVAELAQWMTQGTPAGGSAGTQRLPAHLPVPVADPVKKKVVTPPEVRATANGVVAVEAEPFSRTWDKVLEQVGPMLAAYLGKMSELPAISGPNSLAITFSAPYSSAYETVRGERNQDTLRRALKHVTGREWAIRLELTPEPVANGVHETSPPPPVTAARTRNELLGLPLFVAAADVLGAQLMRTDDGFDPLALPPTAPDEG